MQTERYYEVTLYGGAAYILTTDPKVVEMVRTGRPDVEIMEIECLTVT